MGTSISHSGSGNAPSVPPEADEQPEASSDDHSEEANSSNVSETIPNINNSALSNARSHYARYASGQGGSLQQAVSEYVRAHRGAGNAARASKLGRQSTTKLGGFLSSVARQGIYQTLRDFGLSHLVGQSVNEVVSEILNVIASDTDSREEVISSLAAAKTLGELYEKFALSEGIENLNRMTGADVQEAIRLSVANYIFQRFVKLVQVKLIEQIISSEQAVQAEMDVRNYIRAKVRAVFGDRDILRLDWNSAEASKLIEDIYIEAHSILE